MRITPLDIRKQPFRKTMRGFDPDEVNSFLEQVANEFETVIRQNNELSTQAKLLNQKLSDYTVIEKTLNETLISAQRTSDEARINAQKEAELILRDAQGRADRYEDESRRRVHDLENQLTKLKTQRDSFLARFKSMLKNQLELLDIISGDLRSPGEEEKGDFPRMLDSDETMAEVPPQSSVSSLDG